MPSPWVPEVIGFGAAGQPMPLNPLLFATPEGAAWAASFFPGASVGELATAPGSGRSVPELTVNVPGAADPLNAGLVAQQLGYALQGRLNADTGQYEQDPMWRIMEGLQAELAGPGAMYRPQYMDTPPPAWAPEPGASGFLNLPPTQGTTPAAAPAMGQQGLQALSASPLSLSGRALPNAAQSTPTLPAAAPIRSLFAPPAGRFQLGRLLGGFR